MPLPQPRFREPTESRLRGLCPSVSPDIPQESVTVYLPVENSWTDGATFCVCDIMAPGRGVESASCLRRVTDFNLRWRRRIGGPSCRCNRQEACRETVSTSGPRILGTQLAESSCARGRFADPRLGLRPRDGQGVHSDGGKGRGACDSTGLAVGVQRLWDRRRCTRRSR